MLYLLETINVAYATSVPVCMFNGQDHLRVTQEGVTGEPDYRTHQVNCVIEVLKVIFALFFKVLCVFCDINFVIFIVYY